jgi:hypothetical protein
VIGKTSMERSFFEYTVLFFALLLALNWLCQIRKNIAATNLAVTNNSIVALMLFVISILAVLLCSISYLNLIWMFFLSWIISIYSSVTPFSILQFPANFLGNLIAINLAPVIEKKKEFRRKVFSIIEGLDIKEEDINFMRRSDAPDFALQRKCNEYDAALLTLYLYVADLYKLGKTEKGDGFLYGLIEIQKNDWTYLKLTSSNEIWQWKKIVLEERLVSNHNNNKDAI